MIEKQKNIRTCITIDNGKRDMERQKKRTTEQRIN